MPVWFRIKKSVFGLALKTVVSFAAVFRVVTQRSCVTTLKTAAKETIKTVEIDLLMPLKKKNQKNE